MANNAQRMSHPQRLHNPNPSRMHARRHCSTQTWHTLVHPPTETIYVKNDNLWHLYCPTTRSRTSVSFITTSHEPPPNDTLPITTDPTTNHRHQLRINTYSKREDTIIFQQPPVTSFQQFLRNLPTHERWVIGHVLPQSPTDMNIFLEAILIRDFGLGSDSSVKGLSTTYSSRIQSRSTLHTFITSHSKSEPTRAKAYGYLGCLYLLRAANTYLLSHGTAIPSLFNQQTNTWTIYVLSSSCATLLGFQPRDLATQE